MKFPAWLAFLHKWLGLIIGIQIILWMSGGFVMSFFHIDKVRGEHNIARQETLVIDEGYLRVSLTDAIARHAPDGVSAASLKSFMGQSVYDLAREDGTHVLVDTRSGGQVEIDEATVRGLANADFAGTGAIAEITLIDATNSEYRGPTPVWRVRFDDEEDTRLYFHPDTGRTMARRNGTWRLYDFFWMLHIMDYEDRENFNNPLVITASVLALITVLMGVGLMFYRLKLRDWRVMFARKR